MMNIFKVLASGDGTLKEPNISALLSFLLDPSERHPLKDQVLSKFLDNLEVPNVPFLLKCKIEIETEPPLHSNEERNFSDIKITFYEENNRAPYYIIFIENKITFKALQKNVQKLSLKSQMEKQVDGFKMYYSYYIKKNPDLSATFVFLTPDDKKCADYFEQSKLNFPKEYNVQWMVWKKETDKNLKDSVYDIINNSVCTDKSFNLYILQPFLEFIESRFYPITFTKGNKFKNRVSLTNFEEFSKAITNSVFYDYYEIIKKDAGEINNKFKKTENRYFLNPIISNRSKTMVSFALHNADLINDPEYYFRIQLTRSTFVIRLNVKNEFEQRIDLSKWKRDKEYKTQVIYQITLDNFDLDRFINAKKTILEVLKYRIQKSI